MENFQLILKKLHDTDPEMFGQTQMVLAFLGLAKVENLDVKGLADMLNCERGQAEQYVDSLSAAGLADYDKQSGSVAISRQGQNLAESLERAIT